MKEVSQSILGDSARDIKKVAKGAGITFFGTAIGRCLFFTSQVIIARFFSTEVFGLFTLGLTIIRIAEILSCFGIHAGGMRLVSIYRRDDTARLKGTLISAFIIPFINGILIGSVIYFCASFISETIFHKLKLTGIIKNFAFCIPFVATTGVIGMASRGFHTAKYSVLIKDIIQPSAIIIFIIGFILAGLDISWTINAFTLSYVVGLISGFYLITKQFPEIKKITIKPVYETKKLLSLSAPLMLNNFLNFLIMWTGTLMLGFMKTPTDVGIYRAASQIPIFLTLILVAFNSIYAPSVAELHHRGQMDRLDKIFKITTRWVFLVAFPASIIIIFSPREIMALFGSNYIETGASVLIILTIAQLINCVTGGVTYTLSMTGKQNLEMLNSLAMVVINIALNYFLIPKYGSLGAAISTGTSIVAINLIRLLEVFILYRIQPYSTGYIQGILSGIFAITMLYFFGKYLQDYSNITRLSIHCLGVGFIFIISFITLGINNEDRLLFDSAKKKFNLKMRFSKV